MAVADHLHIPICGIVRFFLSFLNLCADDNAKCGHNGVCRPAFWDINATIALQSWTDSAWAEVAIN